MTGLNVSVSFPISASEAYSFHLVNFRPYQRWSFEVSLFLLTITKSWSAKQWGVKRAWTIYEFELKLKTINLELQNQKPLYASCQKLSDCIETSSTHTHTKQRANFFDGFLKYLLDISKVHWTNVIGSDGILWHTHKKNNVNCEKCLKLYHR